MKKCRNYTVSKFLITAQKQSTAGDYVFTGISVYQGGGGTPWSLIPDPLKGVPLDKTVGTPGRTGGGGLPILDRTGGTPLPLHGEQAMPQVVHLLLSHREDFLIGTCGNCTL